MTDKILIWVVPFVTAMTASLAGSYTQEFLRQRYKGQTATEWAATLKAPDVESRRSAAAMLVAMGPNARAALYELIEALNDDDAVVRRLAVQSIGNLGPAARDASTILADKLEDEDGVFVRYCIGALQKIESPQERGIKPQSEESTP
jgi:HEAT repeat protein